MSDFEAAHAHYVSMREKLRMEGVEALKLAKSKLEKGWVQGLYAIDAEGRATQVWDKNATCWCSSGALEAAVVEQHGMDAENWKTQEACNVMGVARDMLCYGIAAFDVKPLMASNIVSFNDLPSRTKEEVLAAFDKAIELGPVVNLS